MLFEYPAQIVVQLLEYPAKNYSGCVNLIMSKTGVHVHVNGPFAKFLTKMRKRTIEVNGSFVPFVPFEKMLKIFWFV